MRLVAAAHGFQHADFLQVDAGPHAPPAEHALVHVAHDRVARPVHVMAGLIRVPETEEVDPVLLGQRLQFAVIVARTTVAFAVVLGEEQVDDVAPRLPDLAGMRFDRDRLGDRIGAACLKGAAALPLQPDKPGIRPPRTGRRGGTRWEYGCRAGVRRPGSSCPGALSIRGRQWKRRPTRQWSSPFSGVSIT